jgi:acyl transferase domain-containing protein/NADP-dependent 3-hydroxy acid dehydrogenase YdfG
MTEHSRSSALETSRSGPVPVAIIGMGCLFPGAGDLTRYWANIRDRRDGITEVPETHWKIDDYYDPDPRAADRTYARRGGFLAPVDFPALEFGIAPNNLDATDTTQLLGLLAARTALEDAGYAPGSGRDFDRTRVSVILGVTGTLELVIPLGARLGHPIWRRALKAAGVDDATAHDVVHRISESYVGWQENSFPGLLGNVAAGRIANRLDLGGTNCVIDAACASSLGAIDLALHELAAGRSDMVLSGGFDTFNDIFMYMCFSKTPALSPTGDARPFDAAGDGTILGEGMGVVVLKRLDDARRDGDRVYAVIRAVGSSSDGKGSAIYAPTTGGQARALRRAYALAGISPATVELVEAHGTGTKVGDATELAALTEVYREADRTGSWCALGSVKSQIGHTKAAAGAAGLMKAALSLYHKVLPPTIKVTRPIEALTEGRSPFYVNTEPRPWLSRGEHPRRAAVSAFGFGGSNFHCVLEEADPEPPGIDWDGDVQIVALSAHRPDDLVTALDGMPWDQGWEAIRNAAVRTRTEFRVEDACRLLVVIQCELTDAARIVAKARRQVAAGRSSPADGIFVGNGAPAGGLAMLFPGQGSQYVGMLRELACRFPMVHAALARADASPLDGGRLLSDLIYPHPAFSDDERTVQEAALRDTAVAQPALGALSLGLLRLLEHFGVRPAAVAGHSFGELTALCAAGRIDADGLEQLARARGQLMAGRATAPGSETPPPADRGAMLAVMAPLDRVEAVLRADALDLVIANKNAPDQAVLSGATAEIARAARRFEERGTRSRILDVSAAFHSRFVADARGPFADALRAIPLGPGRIPVYANTTAGLYPDDPGEARALLGNQLAQPIEFVAEIEAMHRAGLRTFLEVGPDRKLTALVGAILGSRAHAALAVNSSRGQRSDLIDLAHVLAQLAALGHAVDLSRWDDEVLADSRYRTAPGVAPTHGKPGLTVKVCGANPTPSPRNDASEKETPSAPSNGDLSAPMMPATPRRLSEPDHVPAPRNGDTTVASKTSRNGTTLDRGHSQNAAPTAPALTAHSSDSPLLAQALRSVQENLAALQKLGEQTAQLHRQFLEGQDQTQRTFQTLLEQQQRIVLAALGASPSQPLGDGVPHKSPALPTEVSETAADAAGPLSHPGAPPQEQTGAQVTRIQQILTAIVAEKTGYPAEILEPNMRLDADLGIDSIKRVEILAALQEQLPDAPVVKPEHLGTLQTLADIVEFLASGETGANAARHTLRPSTPPPVQASRCEEPARIQQVLTTIVAEKTGYPAEILEPTMRLDADLGIDSIKRVEILAALQEQLPDAPIVKPEHLGTLQTLGQIVEFLSAGTIADDDSPEPRASPQPPAQAVTLQRFVLRSRAFDDHRPGEPLRLGPGSVVWIFDGGGGTELSRALVKRLQISGYDGRLIRRGEHGALAPPEPCLGALLLLAGTPDAGDATIKEAFHLLRTAGPALRQSGRAGAAVLATITRLDGVFGSSGRVFDSPTDPVQGGLAGLAKTASHEWPDVACKAIDIEPAFADRDSDRAAEAILDAVFRRGPVEVGLTRGGRSTLELVPTLIACEDAGNRRPVLSRGDVVVISGGARGVTAEVAAALAQAFQPTVVLLGRSPAPEPEPTWLAALPTADEPAIKRALAARGNVHSNGHGNGHATPQLIGEQFRQIAASREIAHNLARIEAAGAKVIYRAVDVRDTAAVEACLDTVRAEHGPIRGLIHGAGVLADRRIEDQTDEQFAAVYDTKVAGLRNLLASLRRDMDDLRFLVLFSSSTARFGRTGQVAYAAANEALNKLAWHEAAHRPRCRVVSVNWGPWEGGMVTPALRPLFEAEGIGLIPLSAGAEYLIHEIGSCAHEAVEVVVLGGTSVPVALATPVAPEPPVPSAPPPPSALSVVFEQAVDVAAVPILHAHVIDDRPVLPMALILEWLAQGAVQRNPGLTFCGVQDLRLLKGVIVRHEQPETLRVLAGKATRADGLYRVAVELRGTAADGREFTHARGAVLLGDRLAAPTGEDLAPLATPAPGCLDAPTLYRDVLFHGPDLRGIESVEGCDAEGVDVLCRTAPPPAEWLQRPLRQVWLGDPLALDCAFQAMVIWSFARTGVCSLPTAIGRYRQFRRSFPTDVVRVVARVTHATERSASADIAFVDSGTSLVARIYEYECVIDASLNQAFRRNRLAQVAPR